MNDSWRFNPDLAYTSHDISDLSNGDQPCRILPFPGPKANPVPSSRGKLVSVIIPVFNEAENLVEMTRQTIAAMLAAEKAFEIVYVDDGSNDESWDTLQKLATEYDSIRVVQLNQNYGQTAALRAGIDASIGDYIVTIDGDLQNDPADIANMLTQLEGGVEIVFGWRKNRHDDWARKQASKIANWLVRCVLGTHVKDLGCTLKAMTRAVAQRLELCGDMHRFIPVLTDRLGVKSNEIEVNHRPRTRGATKYGFERVPRVLQDLITLSALKHRNNPMRFFGRWSLRFLGASFLLSIATAVGLSMDMPIWIGWILACSCLMAGIASIQLVGFGTIAELNCRTHLVGTPYQQSQLYSVKCVIGAIGERTAAPGVGDSTDAVFESFSLHQSESRVA